MPVQPEIPMNHNHSSLSIRRRWILRYGLAFVAVAAGYGLRVALTAWIGPGLPTYITFYPAVMVTALLAGFGPGLLATVLVALISACWILPPEGFAITSPVDRIGLVLFIGMGFFMSVVAELYRRDRRKAAAYDQEMALRESQDALRQNEALLRGITDNSPDPIFLKDRNSRMLLANPAALAALQKRAEEVLGKTDEEFYDDPAIGRLMMANDRRVMESGQTEMMEELIPGPSGPRTFLSAKTPYRDAEGRIIGIIGVARDITERKRAEQALRKLNEELELRVAERTMEVRAASLYARNLIETSLDPLITISKDGKITDVNHATELATGAPRERLIGSNFSDYFTEPDKASASYQKVIAEGLVRDYPLTIRHAAGRTTHVLYNAAVYRNEAGEIQGVFAAARDITEHKRMEDAHSDLQRRLIKAQETERGRISREFHDRLGQDLTALKLGLQMFRKQKAFSPSVQASIGQLENLADSLMQDIHRLAWELRPAALDDFGLDMALRRYASEWSEHNGVATDFHSQGVETHRLPTEFETTLYRITQEALTNVLRHAKAQRVSVLLERRPDHVLLIVEDDGRGFDAQAVLKAPGAHGRLGLLGMQERVILVNGTFEIESAPGAGTTVFVRIPLESKIPAMI